MTAPVAPLLSLIICTYKRPDLVQTLLECIDTARHQDPSGPWEAVIIDNGQNPETCDIVRASPHYGAGLRLIEEPKAGLSVARNTGARAAQGDWMMFLDDDVTFGPEFVPTALAILRTDAPDVLTGQMTTPMDPDWPDWLRIRVQSGVGQYDLGDSRCGIDRRSKTPVGACFCIHRSVMERFGPYREDLGRTAKKALGGEETLLMRTAFEAGVTGLYDPALRISHNFVEGKVSKDYWLRQAYFGGRSHVRMIVHRQGGTVRRFDMARLVLRSIAMAGMRKGVSLTGGAMGFENRYRATAHFGRAIEALGLVLRGSARTS